jgi:hypothetical protein
LFWQGSHSLLKHRGNKNFRPGNITDALFVGGAGHF